MSNRSIYIITSLIIFTALAYNVYVFIPVYLTTQREAETEATREAKIIENRARLFASLADIESVNARDAARGFWYTYKDENGNESVGYFNADSLAQYDMTDEEIATLISRIKDSEPVSKEFARAIPNEELPPVLQFHNNLYTFRQDNSFFEMKNELKEAVSSPDRVSSDLFKLSYLAELSGDYATRDALNKENCVQFEQRCSSDTFLVTLTGRVVDIKGDAIQGATVTALSRPNAQPVITNADGIFTLTLSVNEMEKVRISASKRNFSEGVVSVVILSKTRDKYDAETIELSSAINIVTIDTEARTVTGLKNTVFPDGSFELHTKNSIYNIPYDALVHKDGTLFVGQADVYLYEFTNENVPISLLAVDTFDQVMGYAGDLMKSFGMPFIQFFSQDGEELHIMKSKPMELTYSIPEMEDLRTNAKHLYGNLTEADMELLVTASINRPYSIDREFLIHNNLLRFPAFWVYDRIVGIWENIGVTVLDTEGTLKTIFYTINDTRSL